ncbi:hypothetical protein KO489_14870 [Reinekea forsetii]|nr:hypothetical protein [Reinekea forsetii]
MELIDDIIGGLGRGLFRIIGQILGEIVFDIASYFIGWPFLKLFTLGKYPKGMQQAGSTVSSCIGIVVFIFIVLWFYG